MQFPNPKNSRLNKVFLLAVLLLILVSVAFFGVCSVRGILKMAKGTASESLGDSSSINAWISDPLTKVRPFSTGIEQGSSASISTAQNEYEPIQVVLTATNTKLSNVNVTVNLPSIFKSVIYKEDFMNIITPTSMYGDTGEWPDILIPKVDDYVGEIRNAFPMQVNNISKAYPLINALPSHGYGPVNGGPGLTYSNIVPASGFVYPYTGAETGNGNSALRNKGTGSVNAGGVYSGTTTNRWIIVIENSGTVSEATFKWSKDNGATFETGVPVSTNPITLSDGVQVSFSGAGQATDFVAGDEWMFYAGPSRNQPIWIDVYTPKNVSAGTYSGSITITADGLPSKTLPISITVWDFSLPNTASLKNFFGSAAEATQGHKLIYSNSIDRMYVAAGLRNRISIADAFNGDNHMNPSCVSYDESTGNMNIDFSEFDAGLAPYMDDAGQTVSTSDTPSVTFPGKLTTMINTYISMNSSKCSAVDTVKRTKIARQLYAEHLKSKGWFSQFYVYLKDEPSGTGWQDIITNGSQWRVADPTARLLVTTTISAAKTNGVTDYIDIYVPVESHITSHPRSDYNDFLAQSSQHDVWWYQACMESGGCNIVGGSSYAGYSNYAIDALAMQIRMIFWQTRFFDFHGELYYGYNYGWQYYQSKNIDPWDTAYWFGANGDGELFYPGRPDKIGGTTHIPLEALRLKLIREGMEDYEYMHMLDELGQQSFVQSTLSTVITGLRDFTSNPADLKTARASFADKIISLGGAPVITPTPITVDTTPPSAITNLSASNPQTGSITLTWPSPPDPDDAKAESYDIRYSTQSITEKNWASATLASNEPNPGNPGSSENFVVNGLSENTTYFFAIKSKDAAGNISDISNIVNAKTAQQSKQCVKDISSNLKEYIPSSSLFTVSTIQDPRTIIDFIISKVNTGSIKYKEKLNLTEIDTEGCYSVLNLDSLIDIKDKKIKVSSESYAPLNKPATLTFYKVKSAKFKILKDGKECAEPKCKVISYDKNTEILVVDVEGF